MISFGEQLKVNCVILHNINQILLAERDEIINAAISEAKYNARVREAASRAKMFSRADKGPTAADFLARGFKKPSRKAYINGKARLLIEETIKIAEKKLYELKKSQNPSISESTKAEVLAEEVLHTPGSILKQSELTRIFINAGCISETFAENCNRLLNVNRFRTINGVCNNLRTPTQGASATAFRRLLPAVYEDRNNALRGAAQGRQAFGLNPFTAPHPSARVVSTTVVRDNNDKETPFTHILMQWGQFLDHDMDLGPEIEEECEGCTFTDICEPIRVPSTDNIFGANTPNNGDCLTFRRAAAVCQLNPNAPLTPREQVNDLTSYIDGSMIYGSNREQERAVRSFRNGQLRVGRVIGNTRQRLLPVIRPQDEFIACPGREDCFLCGDIRCNEQISLTVMHTIWLREHNRIARRLTSLNPHWSDERTFQEARKIVGALIQKITYEDYLPKVMGPDTFNSLIGRYRGYNPNVDASIPNSFATAAYRYGHSLIRPRFNRLGPGYRLQTPLNLRNMFFNPPLIESSGGTDPIVRGWVTQISRRMDEFLNIVLTTQLFDRTALGGMDLASLNIQRQRDHGMPGYGAFRDFCQRTFRSLPNAVFNNAVTRARFMSLYGDDNNIDLWIGGISERRIPSSLLGPTFACIFGLTFRNVRDGDRFFYERRGVFTSNQLREIKKDSLSRVLCDTSDGIASIQSDAFLGNLTRVGCNRLPSLSLTAWRETVSFLRLQTPLNQFNVILESLRSDQEGAPVTYVNDDDTSCIAFSTPTSLFKVQTYIFPNIKNVNSCKFSSVLKTEAISGEPASFFHSGITPSLLTPSNGIYDSLESCQRGTVAAITWNCDSDMEMVSTESTDINDGDVKPFNSLESPDSLTKAPAGLLKIMNEYFSDDVNKNVEEEEDLDKELLHNKSEVQSDENLLEELQEAITKLN